MPTLTTSAHTGASSYQPLKPLTATAGSVPVSVDCNSCYNHHMAGMVNTALLDLPFFHTRNHTRAYTHYHLYLYLLL